MSQPTQTTTITAIREVVPGVREITLAPPPERVDFRPGQWLSLQLPVGERPPLVRAYSLAAPPAASGELVLCLDRVPEGLGSEHLFQVSVGDTVTFGGPLGNLLLPESDADQLWLARYTGIVPFRSMLGALEQSPPGGKVTLVYSAPRPVDLAYHPELLRAAEKLPWFELLALVDEPGDTWAGQTGAAIDLLPALVGERIDLVPMICGKREFVRPLRDWFYARGYERKTVKWENYD